MRTHDRQPVPDAADHQPPNATGEGGIQQDTALDTSQFRVLAAASRDLSMTLDFEKAIEDVARMSVPALADAVVVRVVDEDRPHRTAIAHVDPSMEQVLRDLTVGAVDFASETPVARALRTREPVLLPDTAAAELRTVVADPGDEASVGALGLLSGMVCPLISRGEPLGTITFMTSVSGRVFTPEDIALGQAVARQAAVAIENARLYAREQDARREVEEAQQRVGFLADLSSRLAATLDTDATLELVAELAVPAIADVCILDVVPDGSSRRVVRHGAGVAAGIEAGLPMVVDDAAGVALVIRTGRPQLIEDVVERATTDDEERLRAFLRSVGVRSYLCVPLAVGERVLGAMTLLAGPSRSLRSEDLALAEGAAQRAAMAVEHARLYSEAREAQRANDETVALLDTLLESAPVGLGFWDRELRYVRVNDALAEINGAPSAAHVGRHVEQLVPTIAPDVRRDLEAVLATGQPRLNVEVSGETAAAPGRLRHWLASYYPVSDAGGASLGVGAVVTEVTERKRAEEDRERLYRDLREFRAMLDTTRDGVYIFDADTLRFRYVNRGAQESTGFTAEELLTITPVDLKPEYDEARFRRVLEPLLRDPQKGATLTTTYRRKDDRTFPVEISLQCVRAFGEPGRVVAIVRDITDRVEARARLQRLAQSERALNAELKAIIRAMGDAVLVMDAAGRVVLANPAAGTILESGPVQRYEDVLRRLDDPERRAPRLGATAPQGPVELSVRDSRDRWLEISAYPVLTPTEVIHEADGPAEVLETILFMREITELRRSRVARDAFIGVLSHELRTPVTTIFGNSKLLGRTDRALPLTARRELTTDIETESERLYRLVEDLLVLARYGEDDAPRDVGDEPVLLQRVVPSVIRSEQPRWPQTRFEALIPSNLPAVEGDPTYVEQVIRNLLSNAAKYGGAEGSRVTIVLEAGETEASVRVLDEGPGFDEADKDRLFDLFYRSPSAQTKASGAGIGLFVCRRLVEAMGGRIWARARPSRGAEFGFVLKLFFEEDM